MRELSLTPSLISDVKAAYEQWRSAGFFRQFFFGKELSVTKVEQSNYFVIFYSRQKIRRDCGPSSARSNSGRNRAGHLNGFIQTSSRAVDESCSRCGGSGSESSTRTWSESRTVQSSEYTMSGEHQVRCPDYTVWDTKSETTQSSCGGCGGSGRSRYVVVTGDAYSTKERTIRSGQTFVSARCAKKVGGERVWSYASGGSIAPQLEAEGIALARSYKVTKESHDAVVEIYSVPVVKVSCAGFGGGYFYLVGTEQQVYSPGYELPFELVAETYESIVWLIQAVAILFIIGLVLAIFAGMIWQKDVADYVKSKRAEREAVLREQTQELQQKSEQSDRRRFLELLLAGDAGPSLGADYASQIREKFPQWRSYLRDPIYRAAVISGLQEAPVSVKMNALSLFGALRIRDTDIENLTLEALRGYSRPIRGTGEQAQSQALHNNFFAIGCVVAVQLELSNSEILVALRSAHDEAVPSRDFTNSVFAFEAMYVLFLRAQSQQSNDNYFIVRGRPRHITQSYLDALPFGSEEKAQVVANYLDILERLVALRGWSADVSAHLEEEEKLCQRYVNQLSGDALFAAQNRAYGLATLRDRFFELVRFAAE